MATEAGEAAWKPPSNEPVAPTRRRRPFCERCVKPATVCLCARLKSPPMDNPIGLTILQHSLEGKHPLNSARVASLGLKNVAVVPISDVLFQAEFSIRPVIDPARYHSSERLKENCTSFHKQVIECADLIPNSSERLNENYTSFDEQDSIDGPDLISNLSEHFKGTRTSLDNQDWIEQPDLISNASAFPNGFAVISSSKEEKISLDQPPDASVDTDLYRITCLSNEVRVSLKCTARPDLGWAISKPVLGSAASNGFTVRKLQTGGKKDSKINKVFEEFCILVPPGSALLFPGKAAVDIESVDFEVKHLFLLDATWDKARRMFYENPWLQILPRIKISVKEESLYKEVRHQPKPGCLSTIESVVCAMKILGGVDDVEKFDELLEVFESMVADQRRLKDEKLRRMAAGNDGPNLPLWSSKGRGQNI